MEQTADEAFALFVDAALKGERAPLNWPFGEIRYKPLLALVREGRIRTEVYGRNWRVVQIMVGEHAGKRTKEHPPGGEPFMVNGKRVFRERAAKVAKTPSGRPSVARQEPWKPGTPVGGKP